MSGDSTIQALKRLSYLPTRAATKNGNLIGGQDYYNVYFTGGALSNVSLTNVLLTSVSSLSFTGVSGASYAAGKLVYDIDNQSLTFFNNDPNVSLQIGQEEWIRVVNQSGSTIPNGSAVYLSGSNGSLPLISLAQANSGTTLVCSGLTTEDIPNNAVGYVTTIGVVRGLNTTAFAAGSTVYLSATVPGALTATAPTAPNYRFRVGIVTVSNATTGSIHVTPSTGAIGNGAANQILGQNAGGGGQEYKTLSVGTAGTDFNIGQAANSVVFNLPDASATARGVVNDTTQTFAGVKTFSSTISGSINGNAATATTAGNVTGVVVGANGGTGIANTGKTITLGGNLTTAGAFATTITATATTSVTLPTSGTVYGTATGSITSAQLATSLTDETGTGSAVFSASPALTGIPTAPTAAANTNSTQLATTAYADAEKVSTQNLVAASRAVNTTYQNTTGKPMFVSVSFGGFGATPQLNFVTDSNATPTASVAQFQANTNVALASIFALVLSGNYYRINASAAITLGTWTEWY